MIPELQKGSHNSEKKIELVINSIVPIQKILRGTINVILIFLSQQNAKCFVGKWSASPECRYTSVREPKSCWLELFKNKVTILEIWRFSSLWKYNRYVNISCDTTDNILTVLLQIYKAYLVSKYAYCIPIYCWSNEWNISFWQKFHMDIYPGNS